MKPVESLIKDHNPAEGRYGDCFRACIASLLELPAENVPHFCDGMSDEDAKDAPEAVEAASRFCFERAGVKYVEIPFNAESLEQLLECAARWFEGTHYTLLGRSGKSQHLVVGCGGEIVHDPTYGTPHGIKGPCDDGLFWIGFLAKP